MNWGKKDAVYVTEESGVIGLNFHQSKEAPFTNENGTSNNRHLDVSEKKLKGAMNQKI